MSQIEHSSSRRLFLATLAGGAMLTVGRSESAFAAGPKERAGGKLRDRKDNGVPVRTASFSAMPEEAELKVLRDSEIGDAARAAERALEIIRGTGGYVTTLIKQEQVRSGGPLLKTTMVMKLRHNPFSVYLKFIDPHAGREVLYVDGQYKGKLQVHEPSGIASLIGTVSLAPNSEKAMEENRYPITMAGIEKGLSQLLTRWSKEAPHGEVEANTNDKVDISGVECTLYEIVHPTSRQHFPMHKVHLAINNETRLPVRLAGYGFPAKKGGQAPLLEEYSYVNLRTDFVLGDADFDVKNRSYGFK